MIKGLKPIDWSKHRGLLRPYSLFGTFEAIVPTLQEFNFNKLQLLPNQDADGLPQACTAYAQLGIASNEDYTVYDDYDWFYRKTLALDGSPYGAPCDIITSLKTGTDYGVKSKTMTEAEALNNRRAPYFIVEKLGDWYDALLSAMQTIQGGISLGTEWQPIFETVGHDGIIPPFTANKNWTEGHDWIAYGQKIINGEPRIICVSHQGRVYGNQGEIYFNRQQINDLLSSNGAGAFGQKHASPQDIAKVRMSILDAIYSFMQQILNLIEKGVSILPMNPAGSFPTKLDTFCLAIRDYEGKPGDLNYINNNPGNCRPSPVGYLPKYGKVTIAHTASGDFAHFETYALGWEYLENLVHFRAELHPNWTFVDFFSNYAPSKDKNNPQDYAQNVADHCGVPVTTTLSQFLT